MPRLELTHPTTPSPLAESDAKRLWADLDAGQSKAWRAELNESPLSSGVVITPGKADCRFVADIEIECPVMLLSAHQPATPWGQDHYRSRMPHLNRGPIYHSDTLFRVRVLSNLHIG